MGPWGGRRFNFDFLRAARRVKRVFLGWGVSGKGAHPKAYTTTSLQTATALVEAKTTAAGGCIAFARSLATCWCEKWSGGACFASNRSDP